MINSIGNLYQNKIKYINILYKVNTCISSHFCYNLTNALNFHIASCNCCLSMHTLGHVEQIREEYGGLQASSREKANISFSELTEDKPRCISPIFFDFCFSIIIYVTVCLCIK
jgi:hypothetical protein